MLSSDLRWRTVPQPPQEPVFNAINGDSEFTNTQTRTPALNAVASMPDLKSAGGKRPKFIQRASQYLIASYGKPKEQDYFTNIQPRQQFQPVPLEQVVNSLQNELLFNSLQPLDVDRNGPMLRVLEGYMNLKAERDSLEDKLEALIRRHDENVDLLEVERKTWKQDEALYKAEVKRMEILIAEGRTGLSQVALARQQSLIRGKDMGRPRGDSDKSVGAQSFASITSGRSSQEGNVPGKTQTMPFSRKTY